MNLNFLGHEKSRVLKLSQSKEELSRGMISNSFSRVHLKLKFIVKFITMNGLWMYFPLRGGADLDSYQGAR